MEKKRNELPENFWASIVQDTRAALEADEVFASYSVFEKVLAFYYTLIELLKPHREAIVKMYENAWFWQLWPEEVEEMKGPFENYMKELIEEGLEQHEVASRPWVTSYYQHPLWYQLMLILKFWVHDKSENRENTDVAIEKAVRLAFDLMGYNTLDSLFDLTKFIVKKW